MTLVDWTASVMAARMGDLKAAAMVAQTAGSWDCTKVEKSVEELAEKTAAMWNGS